MSRKSSQNQLLHFDWSRRIHNVASHKKSHVSPLFLDPLFAPLVADPPALTNQARCVIDTYLDQCFITICELLYMYARPTYGLRYVHISGIDDIWHQFGFPPNLWTLGSNRAAYSDPALEAFVQTCQKTMNERAMNWKRHDPSAVVQISKINTFLSWLTDDTMIVSSEVMGYFGGFFECLALDIVSSAMHAARTASHNKITIDAIHTVASSSHMSKLIDPQSSMHPVHWFSAESLTDPTSLSCIAMVNAKSHYFVCARSPVVAKVRWPDVVNKFFEAHRASRHLIEPVEKKLEYILMRGELVQPCAILFDDPPADMTPWAHLDPRHAQ